MSLLRGRFDAEPDDLLRAFSSSLGADLLMVRDDVEGSMAHVRMLGEKGILSGEEAAAIGEGLQDILDSFEDGSWSPDDSQEDIHMAVEARLIERVGEAGGRLHTARSRNDQVATDVRLWVRRRAAVLAASIRGLITVLVDRAETDGSILIPGYTHLQRGQPIALGHHLLAHAWALNRDLERLSGAIQRIDRSPLGACALAGTPHPIDPHRTAALLDFGDVFDNAMDAVAARDHLQELAAACAITMCTLSRMAEELVLWSSSEFELVRLAGHHATGSSIMPQKRNPDGAELVRGKAGTVFGYLQSLLTIVKGLPLAYNRDLQEERHAIFESVLQTDASVRMMAAMWRDLSVDSHRFESELFGDPSLATELADLLVSRGVPFREAHDAVGRAARWCEEHGGNLSLLDGGAARQFHPSFPSDLKPWLDPRAAVERRTSHGGTAPSEIARQIAKLRALIAEERRSGVGE